MLWNRLTMLLLLYLTIWIFIWSVYLKNLKINMLKEWQIQTLQIKKDLQNINQSNEKAFIENIINIYWYKLYKAIDYEDIIEKFIDSNDNWNYSKWIVYQGWAIWENSELSSTLEEGEYQNIYIIQIYQKTINIIKIK